MRRVGLMESRRFSFVMMWPPHTHSHIHVCAYTPNGVRGVVPLGVQRGRWVAGKDRERWMSIEHGQEGKEWITGQIDILDSGVAC